MEVALRGGCRSPSGVGLSRSMFLVSIHGIIVFLGVLLVGLVGTTRVSVAALRRYSAGILGRCCRSMLVASSRARSIEGPRLPPPGRMIRREAGEGILSTAVVLPRVLGRIVDSTRPEGHLDRLSMLNTVVVLNPNLSILMLIVG